MKRSSRHRFPPGGSLSSLLSLFMLCLGCVLCTPRLHAQAIDLQAQRLAVTSIAANWRFHAGDNPTWSQGAFDDAAWKLFQPAQDWGAQGYSEQNGFAWFRLHLRVPPQTASLVLQVPRMNKSYQLFAEGRLVDAVGSMPPDPPHTVVGAARLFTLEVPVAAHSQDITLALRLWQEPTFRNLRPNTLGGRILAGAPAAMLAQFANAKAAVLLSRGGDYTQAIIVVIIAAASLMLFLLTQQGFYFWFTLCMLVDAGKLPIQVASQHFAWGFGLTLYVYILQDFLAAATFVLFLLGTLNLRSWRRYMPVLVFSFLAEIGPILLIQYNLPPVWANGIYFIFVTLADLLLVWFLVRGSRAGVLDARLLLPPFVLSLIASELLNLGYFVSELHLPHSDWLLSWNGEVLQTPFSISLKDVSDIIVLLGFLAVLVYRFARTSREEHRLASALQAAREIQHRLVPVDIPRFGGLHTEIAYLAAEEVGGDFCQVLPRVDGSILVAIGDVSGKGLHAAMLGTLAVGALRSMVDLAIQPAEALHRLNQVILHTEDDGFITCLCLVITPSGRVTIANAGHLSPYLNGKELAVAAGLPLGIVPDAEYEQHSFALPGTARLTLLSDGVVEARSRSGELLGFDRTCAISHLPASQILAAAHSHGQQDDITIITLDWEGAPEVAELAGVFQ